MRTLRNLLRFSLDETKDEGLWEEGRKRVNTLYVITHCKKIPSPFPMTDLIKVSDDKSISQDFGYSYCLVYEHYPIPLDEMVISPEEIDPTSEIYEGAARQVLVNAYERRSEEHTSELQSRENLVCRLLLEKKKKK